MTRTKQVGTKKDRPVRLSRSAWQGTDVNLDISLFEYGMVWKEHRDQFEFVHPCSHGKGFSRSWVSKTVDFSLAFMWIKDWKPFLDTNGYAEFDEWDKEPLPRKIYDLVNYYGVENVFGGDYYEGFKVKFT